jgi:hypothetical protein
VAFRSDVSIDWSVSPRIITVASPATAITIQDLIDTVYHLEYAQGVMRYPTIIHNVESPLQGKAQIGTGRFTGIVCYLADALLAFEARGGPSWVQCFVTDGDLVAVDSVGALQTSPIEPTAFTTVAYQGATSPGLVSISDEEIEAGISMRQAIGLILAGAGGKTSGAGAAPGPFKIRDTNDLYDRVTATYDASGNRLSVVFDKTGLS